MRTPFLQLSVLWAVSIGNMETLLTARVGWSRCRSVTQAFHFDCWEKAFFEFRSEVCCVCGSPLTRAGLSLSAPLSLLCGSNLGSVFRGETSPDQAMPVKRFLFYLLPSVKLESTILLCRAILLIFAGAIRQAISNDVKKWCDLHLLYMKQY